MDKDKLKKLWEDTLGSTTDQWNTLSAGATYKSDEEDATLSGQTLASVTLSGSTLTDQNQNQQTISTNAHGNYQVLEEIGRGGMGIVYRAEQGSLKREVAIKQIIPEQENNNSNYKFISEALVTGVLDHPNIIPVHDLGQNTDGQIFLAMKLVGGTEWKYILHPETDEHRKRSQDFSQQDHIGVLINVCNAIAFAHSKGIVHRDLKPENIMVGTFGEVLVMDWGIAVDIGDPNSPEQRAQHKDTINSPSGTPSYMAPELAEGRGKDIGPWTDVYLLGAILHEVLTGSPPHTADNLMSVLLAASKSKPAQYDSSIPTGLQEICHKAMARDIEDRYSSVAEFQVAIENYLQHRESMLITDKANTELNNIPKTHDKNQLNAIYAQYAKIVARYEQAIELWPQNEDATTGARQARSAYAELALASGDLGLAEAQAAPMPNDEQATALRAKISEAQNIRHKAAKAAKRNRMALIAAIILIITGLGIGITLVTNEKNKTKEQRDIAKIAEAAAKEQEQRALGALAATLKDEAFNALEQGKHSKALSDFSNALKTEKALLDIDSRTWAQFQLAKLGAHTKLAQWEFPKPAFNQSHFPVPASKKLIGEPSASFIGAAVSPNGTEVIGIWWWSQKQQYRSDHHYGSQIIKWSLQDNKILSTKIVEDKVRSPIWIGSNIIALQFQYKPEDTRYPIGATLNCYNEQSLKQSWTKNIITDLHVQMYLTRTKRETVVVNGIATEIEVDPNNGQTLNRRIIANELLDEKNNEIYYDSIISTYSMTWHKAEPFVRGNWVPDSKLLVIADSVQPSDFINYGRPTLAKGNYSSTLQFWGPHKGSFTSKEGEHIIEFHICDDAIHAIILTNGPVGSRLLRYNLARNEIDAVLNEQVANQTSIAYVSLRGQSVLTYQSDGTITRYGQIPIQPKITTWPQHLTNSTPVHFDIDNNRAIFIREDDSVVALTVPEMDILWELSTDTFGAKRCLGSSVDGETLVFQRIPENHRPIAEPEISLYKIEDGSHLLDLMPPKEKLADDNKFEGMGWMVRPHNVFYHKHTNTLIVYNFDSTPWGIYDLTKEQWLENEAANNMPVGYNMSTGYLDILIKAAPNGVILNKVGAYASGLSGEKQTKEAWHLNLNSMQLQKLPFNINTSIILGSHLLVGNQGGISLWDISNKKQLQYLDLSFGTPRSATTDQQYLLTENEKTNELFIIDIPRGTKLATILVDPDKDLMRSKKIHLDHRLKHDKIKSKTPMLNTISSHLFIGRNDRPILQKPFVWQIQSNLQSIARVTPSGFVQLPIVQQGASKESLTLPSNSGPTPTIGSPRTIAQHDIMPELFREFSKLKEIQMAHPPSHLRSPLSGSPAWRIHYVTHKLASIPASIRNQTPPNKELCQRMERWSKEPLHNGSKFITGNSIFRTATINEQGQRIAVDGSTWYWVPPGTYTLNAFTHGNNCQVSITQGFFIRGEELSIKNTKITLPRSDDTNPHWQALLDAIAKRNEKKPLEFQRAMIAGLSQATSVMRLPTTAELLIAIQLHGGKDAPWCNKHYTPTTLDYWPIQKGTFRNPLGDRGSINWSQLDDKLFISIDRCQGDIATGSVKISRVKGLLDARSQTHIGRRIFPIISGF